MSLLQAGKQAGISDTVKIHQVLDNCHAAHHVSLALKTLGRSDNDRMAAYRDLRSRLRNGDWRYVVKELQLLMIGCFNWSRPKFCSARVLNISSLFYLNR